MCGDNSTRTVHSSDSAYATWHTGLNEVRIMLATPGGNQEPLAVGDVKCT